MTQLGEDLAGLEGQIGDLEQSIGSAQAVSAAFQGELAAMQVTMASAGKQVDGLSRSVGWGLRRAFDGLVFDGMRLSDALKVLGRSMVNSAFTQAMKPVQNALGGFLVNGIESLVSGILPFRDGAAFSQGQVTPFARGGVVSAATQFPMRGGIGLMGEAGPEAIMPLSRGPDGRLGVRAQGGRSVHVTMNISTPDAEGFKRSRSQIAAQMNRAISRGARNT
jgi:hypothetical protein